MDKIIVTCKCGKQYAIPAEYAGRNMRCIHCNAPARVPTIDGKVPEERRSEEELRKSERRSETDRRLEDKLVTDDRRKADRRTDEERRKMARRFYYVPPGAMPAYPDKDYRIPK
jgi:hypothetical protein